MLQYSAHRTCCRQPWHIEYPNLVLFAIWEQRSEDQSANDEYGRSIRALPVPGHRPPFYR